MRAHHDEHGGISTSKYMIGFLLAVILTLLSFIPVMKDMLVEWTIRGKIIYLIGLALIQILVQVAFFLHLNHGPDARWNVVTFTFAALCAFIIIAGTWAAIQYLNYNMMGGSGRIVTPAVKKTIVPEATKAKGQKQGHGVMVLVPVQQQSFLEKLKTDVHNAAQVAQQGLHKLSEPTPSGR